MIVKGLAEAGHTCTDEPFVKMLVVCSLTENSLWYVERWVERMALL